MGLSPCTLKTEKELKPGLSWVDTLVGLVLPESNSGVETTLEGSALGMDASVALDVVAAVVAVVMEATADGWELHVAVVAVAVQGMLHFEDLVELDLVLKQF